MTNTVNNNEQVEIKEVETVAGEENLIEVPVTQSGQVPVSEESTEQADTANLLNLEDVAFMVMIGRTKDGQAFFRTAGVNDLFMISGLVDYAQAEVKFNFEKFLFEQERAKQIQAQQALQAQQAQQEQSAE